MSRRLATLLFAFLIAVLFSACVSRRGEIPELPDPLVFKGVVWLDEDVDGILMGEDQVEGVQVFLLDTGGNVIDSDTTEAYGLYTLETTLERTGFIIEFEAPIGFLFTIEGVGNEENDSDVNPETGRTQIIDPNSEEFSEVLTFRNNAGVFAIIDTPTPTNTPKPTETPTPAVFMPSRDTHILDARFYNGTNGCGLIPEFNLPFEAEIDGDKLILRSIEESFVYTGVIQPDGSFEVMDENGFEKWEGKFNPDWSGEARNSLTEGGCTTTWDVAFISSE